MTKVYPLDSVSRAPPRDVVLGTQGIPPGHQVSEQVEALVEKAITLYERLALPKGVMAEISLADFQEVFTGEGMNTLPAPLPGIVERAVPGERSGHSLHVGWNRIGSSGDGCDPPGGDFSGVPASGGRGEL